jgi:hypothetical protein
LRTSLIIKFVIFTRARFQSWTVFSCHLPTFHGRPHHRSPFIANTLAFFDKRRGKARDDTQGLSRNDAVAERPSSGAAMLDRQRWADSNVLRW